MAFSELNILFTCGDVGLEFSIVEAVVTHGLQVSHHCMHDTVATTPRILLLACLAVLPCYFLLALGTQEVPKNVVMFINGGLASHGIVDDA